MDIAEVDAQHKELVNMLNELHEAMSGGRGKQVLRNILDRLADYTVYHFATEENLFAMHDYPAGALHKAQHVEFVQRVSEFKEMYARGEATLSIDVLNYLADWVTTHVQGSDREFGPFLKSCGVQ